MAIVNILESVSGALEGQALFGAQSELRETRTNAAVVKPGRLVTRDAHDRKVKLPTTAAEVRAIRGMTELTDTQPLNSSGEYAINTRLSIVRKGVVGMVAVAAATQGQPVYVYYGAGDATLRGKVSGTFVDGENALLPGAKFFTSGDAAAIVGVELDLPGDAANADFGTNGYVDVVVDLGAQSAATVAEVSTTVAGSLAGDVFVVTALTALDATIVICDARCRVDGTVVWRIFNASGTPNPASNTFRFALVSRQ